MIDFSQVKLGWNPDTLAMKAAMPQLSAYLITAEFEQMMEKVPTKNAWSAKVLKSGKYIMGGNDEKGDCTLVNVANDILTKSANAANALRVPDQIIIDQYDALTGGQDTGLYMEQLEKAYLSPGLFQTDSRYANKILAWASFDPTNDDLVRWACYYFGGIGYGVALPNTAAWQIKKGLPWDYIANPTAEQGSNEKYSWGGHSIHVPDFAVFGESCVTWQMLQAMTKAFRKAYADFAGVRIDLNWFNAVHKTPVIGLAYKDLVSDMSKYILPATS